jgi:hypothetical protein
MFEQLEGTLSQAHRLLWSRYGDAVPVSSPTPSASTSSTHLSAAHYVSASAERAPSPSRHLSGLSLRRSSPTSMLVKVKWALRDKKQAEQLLNDFNDLNVRILDQTKFLLISSTLGRELEYCTLLQENSSARALGFDADARLRIMAVDEESALRIENLEIPPSTINFPSPASLSSTSGVSICQVDSENLAFEFKSLTAGAGNENVVRQRTRQLAALLNQEKNPRFRVLQCRGYTYLASRNQFAFLYNIPEGYEPKPVSLLDELRNRKSKPSLGDKFRLAFVLASSISQLHMVQWVSSGSLLQVHADGTTVILCRFTRVSAAKRSFSFRIKKTRSNTTSHGSLGSSTVVRQSILPRARSKTISRTTFIATQTVKGNHPRASQKFTIFTLLVRALRTISLMCRFADKFIKVSSCSR